MSSREKMVVFSIAGLILIMLIIAVSALWLDEKRVEASSKLKCLKFIKILKSSFYTVIIFLMNMCCNISLKYYQQPIH